MEKNLMKTHNYTSVKYCWILKKHEINVKVHFGDIQNYIHEKCEIGWGGGGGEEKRREKIK